MGQQSNGAPPQANQQAAFNQWNPSQYGQGIPQDLLNGILNNGWRTAPNADYSGSVGQFTVQQGQPQYSSDPNGNPLPTTYSPTEIAYHPQGQGPTESYPVYDSNGKFLRTEQGSNIQGYASGVLSVIGAAMGMGALGAAAGAAGDAGSAGGFVGEGAASGVPEWDGALANTPSWTAGAPAFNAAKDSQLASDQLGITGAQSGADAAAAPIPSVTVNGVPGGNPISLSDALKIGSKVYGQMGQQHQQAQTPVWTPAQDNRPPSFVGQTPGFAPIASPPKRNPMLGGLNNPWSPYLGGLMGGMNG